MVACVWVCGQQITREWLRSNYRSVLCFFTCSLTLHVTHDLVGVWADSSLFGLLLSCDDCWWASLRRAVEPESLAESHCKNIRKRVHVYCTCTTACTYSLYANQVSFQPLGIAGSIKDFMYEGCDACQSKKGTENQNQSFNIFSVKQSFKDKCNRKFKVNEVKGYVLIRVSLCVCS